jgi:hypothetical protein
LPASYRSFYLKGASKKAVRMSERRASLPQGKATGQGGVQRDELCERRYAPTLYTNVVQQRSHVAQDGRRMTRNSLLGVPKKRRERECWKLQ